MMFWQKSKTMQYASAKYFHFTVQYAYLREGKRVFSFCFKTKNTSKQQSWTLNQRQAIFYQTDFSFLKAKRRGRISFPKWKTNKHTICKCTLFFRFSQKISKSNIKLPFFFILIEIALNAWVMKYHKGYERL